MRRLIKWGLIALVLLAATGHIDLTHHQCVTQNTDGTTTTC